MKHNLASLSFAKIGAAGQILSLWQPAAAGQDYAVNCNEGRRRADEVLRFMERHEDPNLLGHVVAAIVSSTGDLGGLETGFFSRISTLAIEGVLHGRAAEPKVARTKLTLVEPG